MQSVGGWQTASPLAGACANRWCRQAQQITFFYSILSSPREPIPNNVFPISQTILQPSSSTEDVVCACVVLLSADFYRVFHVCSLSDRFRFLEVWRVRTFNPSPCPEKDARWIGGNDLKGLLEQKTPGRLPVRRSSWCWSSSSSDGSHHSDFRLNTWAKWWKR